MSKKVKKIELIGGPYSGQKVEMVDGYVTADYKGKPAVYKLYYCIKTRKDYYLWVGYNNPKLVNGHKLPLFS